MRITKNTFSELRERQAMFMESEYEHKKITAENVMITPIFLYLDDDIEIILEKLQSEEINYCVVVDENHHFVGEISDEMLLKIIAHTSVNELLVKILDVGYKRGINYTHTRDYVKKSNHTIRKETPLYEVMKLIDKKGFQFIPVVDEDKKVIGLITPSSILRFILKK